MADVLFKLLPVPLAQLLFFVTTNSQSLNQAWSQPFLNQGRPGRLKLFYKEADGAHGRKRRRTKEPLDESESGE